MEANTRVASVRYSLIMSNTEFSHYFVFSACKPCACSTWLIKSLANFRTPAFARPVSSTVPQLQKYIYSTAHVREFEYMYIQLHDIAT